MAVVDLTNDQARYDAIASGVIWSTPQGAQEQACQDIASGAVPMPSYLPDYARARIAQIKGVASVTSDSSNEGSGPV